MNINELPQYKCHKVVRAAKITAVAAEFQDGHCELSFDSNGEKWLAIGDGFYEKHEPRPGKYFVVYEDGYQSVSPAAAFEAGYTLVEVGTSCGGVGGEEYAAPANTGFQWRKKPVVIEAFQWMGEKDLQGKPQWIVDAIKGKEVWFDQYGLQIGTLEGIHTASTGDWIIRGVKGELYPCKPDIFSATYEPAEAPQQPISAEVTLRAIASKIGMDLSGPLPEGELSTVIINAIRGGTDDFPDVSELQAAGKYTASADWALKGEIDLDAADFSDALMWLKEGKRVCRSGWNAGGQWVVLIHPGNAMYTKGGASAPMQSCFGLKNAQGNMQPGWAPSIGDLMATDWQVFSESAVATPSYLFEKDDGTESLVFVENAQPHQVRVIDEYKDLQTRHQALTAFFDSDVYRGLDVEERNRLKEQCLLMGEYLRVLLSRMQAF